MSIDLVDYLNSKRKELQMIKDWTIGDLSRYLFFLFTDPEDSVVELSVNESAEYRLGWAT